MFLKHQMKLCPKLIICNMNIVILICLVMIISLPIVGDIVSERSRKCKREKRLKEIKMRKSMEKNMD
jgi:hypothetical protein